MMSNFQPGKLLDFFRYFDEERTSHIDAINKLQDEIEALDPSLMSDEADWVKTFREESKSPPPPVNGYFTPLLMEQLTGYKYYLFDDVFINDLNEMMKVTRFDQHRDAMCMLYANLAHESLNFKYMKEIDPGHYLNNRLDLGNRLPNDGPRFRGCGPLQVTGRASFEAFYRWLKDTKGIDDSAIVEIGTEYVAQKYPFQIAVSWIERNDLLNICLTQGFEACCVRINGGYNGWKDRLEKWDHAKQFIL